MTEKRVHGGNIKEFCQKQGFVPGQVVDFSTNVNFLGPPANALAAIGKNLESIKYYPDCLQDELRSVLGEYLALPKENILLGNGSADLIFLLCRYIQPRKALIFTPTFSEYGIAVGAVGGEAIHLDMKSQNGFTFPLWKALTAINDVDLVFVCNPNNPTGTLLQPKEVLELVKAAQGKEAIKNHKITTVVDEAFIDFVGPANSLRPQAVELNNLIILGSLTKFFAIPGLRLGYIIADPNTIEELTALRDPWSINCFAEIAGKEVFKDKHYLSRSIMETRKNRRYLVEQLNLLGGFKPYSSAANFILVEISGHELNSHLLQKRLAPYGILIRNCDSFRDLNDRYIRLAVRSISDIDYLISSIKQTLNFTRNNRIPKPIIKASHKRS